MFYISKNEKKLFKILSSFFCIFLFAFAFLGCSMLNSSSTSDSSETERSLGDEFTFSGYEFSVVSGTATLTSDNCINITKPTEGIAIALSKRQTTQLLSTYDESKGFYIEAQLFPSKIGSGKNKNFGIAGLISEDSTSFSYAGVNFNGRCQLGELPSVPKGLQFGSLMSDSSYIVAESNWTDFYTIRYEYINGEISGYINGIQFMKSGKTKYKLTEDLSKFVNLGGIYTNGGSFSMKSFKVGSADTGLNTIKLIPDNTLFVTLNESEEYTSKGYIFLTKPSISVQVGDAPITYTVTALDDEGTEEEWSVNAADSNILTVETLEDKTGFKVEPIAVGTTTVTVTSTSGTTRTIEYIVNRAASYIDTDYETYTAFYPTPKSEGIYEDDILSIKFDDIPTLCEGVIKIFDSNNIEVDSISIGSDKDTINGTKYTLKNFMIQINDKTVYIKPHTGILKNGESYYVGIADGTITGNINGKTFTGFAPSEKRWSFTTRTTYSPANRAAITVDINGSNTNADYRTLQAALNNASNNAVITVKPGIYREIINYTTNNNITIKGNTDKQYGSDVIIQGINCNSYNGSSSTRCAMHWQGGNLVLQNITIQNAYDRNIDGTAQSEALYFDNASSKLVAYNSSFLGHQDTLLTKGKNWFYKCYIEGDTDFIWGYADVCLLEECKLVQLNTSSDTVSTSGSYIFETRVGSDATSNSTVSKGYVLFNCKVASLHPKSYFARRASAKSSAGSNYYDQVAIINTNFYSDKDCTSAAAITSPWGFGNEPCYIEKDANGNMNVGWKAYGGSGYTNISNQNNCGTITDAIYNAEYDGRAVILNRVYKKSGKYVNASEIWDFSAYETEFSATKDNSEFIVDETVIDGANGTYDILALAKAKTGSDSFNQNDPLTDGSSDDTYLSWKNLLFHSDGYGVVTNSKAGSESEITLRLSGPSVVTWTGSCYSNGTVTVTTTDSTLVNARSTKESTDKTSQGFIYTGESATDVKLSFNAKSTYINNIVVSVLDDEKDQVTQISIDGSSTVVVDDSTTLSATVICSYLSTDDSIKWTSSDTSIATVDSNGVVKGISDGTVTITATSGATNSTTATIEITVSSEKGTAKVGSVYTWNFIGKQSVPTTMTNTEGDGLTLTISGSPQTNTGYGFYNADATYSFPVAGDCTIIAYATYLNAATCNLSLSSTKSGTVESDQTLDKANSLWGNSSDHKPANGPIAYVWRYTGSADTLVLSVPAQVYMGQIVVDNSKTQTSLTQCSYDFTESSLETPLSPSDGSSKIHWFGESTAMYKNSQYGIQTIGTTFFTFYVGGACTITFTDTYDSGSTVNLYDIDGTKLAFVTTESSTSAKEYSLSYSGSSATILRLQVPKNVYISKIEIQ